MAFSPVSRYNWLKNLYGLLAKILPLPKAVECESIQTYVLFSSSPWDLGGGGVITNVEFQQFSANGLVQLMLCTCHCM